MVIHGQSFIDRFADRFRTAWTIIFSDNHSWMIFFAKKLAKNIKDRLFIEGTDNYLFTVFMNDRDGEAFLLVR